MPAVGVSGRGHQQELLPQDDELLPQDEELPQDDELQEDELLQEEPADEPSHEESVAYQDDQLDELSPPPVADAVPAPLLAAHAPWPCPLARPLADACQPRSSQARRHARRMSQAHSAAIPRTAAPTRMNAVTMTFPPPTGACAPAARTMPPAPAHSIPP